MMTAVIVWLGIKYGPFLTKLAASPGHLETFLEAYGNISTIVFIGLQCIQVIIAAVPGELLEIAGGYIYGTFSGTVYSLIGIALGSAINFYIARLFGFSLLRLFIPEKTLVKLSTLLNGQKSKSAMLILFLLPGIPKDILCYISGLLPVRPLFFLIASTLARIPALIVTCYIGANLREENYLIAAIVAGAACLILILAFFLKKRMTRLLASNQENKHKKFRDQWSKAIRHK